MIAFILAGGKGSRLAPWHAPKCLLPINGVPILYRLLGHLDADLEMAPSRVVVCAGWRADDVRAALAVQEREPEHIAVSDLGEDAPMGTRLLGARAVLSAAAVGERVLVCYGDELADVNLRKLVQQHEQTHAQVTFAAAPARLPGGTIELIEQVRIVEDQPRWVNIGFALVEPSAWRLLHATDGLSDFLNRVAATGAATVYYHEGKRATVNSLADLAHAEEVWK